MRCPHCGHSLEALIAPYREAAERDRLRRIKLAAKKRHKYQTDPAYRARHLARVRKAPSTLSVAADHTHHHAGVRTLRLGE